MAAVTSLPNAVAAVYLARSGRGAAALSTALNSNAINVTAGLLIPATSVAWQTVGVGTPRRRLVPGSHRSDLAPRLYPSRGRHRISGWAAIIALHALFVAAS